MHVTPNMRRFFLLAWAVIKGFFWPVAAAICIVAYGAYAPWQPSKEAKEHLQAFFAVLFFIMFFFGQYKRVEKQTDDKDSFKNVNEKLISLQELVRAIRPTQVSTVSTSRVAVGDASTLLAESRTLLESGHALAALLQAGVAFEHSLRNFARHFKGEEAAVGPLHEIIRRMAPQEMTGELHALRMIRNRLVHVSENELSDLPDAERILAGYEGAVAELSHIVRRESAA
jgi:hypothetical protein